MNNAAGTSIRVLHQHKPIQHSWCQADSPRHKTGQAQLGQARLLWRKPGRTGSQRVRRTRRLRLVGVVFFFVWVLLTLYPSPMDLARSVYRVFNPPVDAEYAAAFSALFADAVNAHEIDTLVRSEFPYQYDWVTYNRPWYFPTVQEAFAAMAGDCKTQLLVLASVLESRGIPYSFSVSPTHVWVEYDGKPVNRIENAQVAMFSSGSDRSLMRPSQFDFARSFDSFWTAFWGYMPARVKLSLLIGLVISIVLIASAGVVVEGAAVLDDSAEGLAATASKAVPKVAEHLSFALAPINPMSAEPAGVRASGSAGPLGAPAPSGAASKSMS